MVRAFESKSANKSGRSNVQVAQHMYKSTSGWNASNASKHRNGKIR